VEVWDAGQGRLVVRIPDVSANARSFHPHRGDSWSRELMDGWRIGSRRVKPVARRRFENALETSPIRRTGPWWPPPIASIRVGKSRFIAPWAAP